VAKDKSISGILLDVWRKPEPYFKFTLPKFANGFMGKHDPWRVEPEDKKTSVHRWAGTQDALAAVFPSAIAIGSPAGRLKSALLVGGLLIPVFGMVMSVFIGAMSGTEIIFGLVVAIMWFVVSALMFSWGLRLLLCNPEDWPVFFNRENQTVTYAPVKWPHFFKFWKTKIDQTYRTKAWGDVRVRSYKSLESNGGRSFHDSYDLSLLWGGEGGDPKALSEYVNIGYRGYFEDERLWSLWEHIRRYMEEDGPPIQHGESLRKHEGGKPVIYPPEVIAAAGGPPLSEAEVEKLAAQVPPQE